MLSGGCFFNWERNRMIKFNNSIRTIVTAVILPVIFSSCIREEMTCGNQIVVQRIGEDGGAVTRGTAVSSVSDLENQLFGFSASLTPAASATQMYFNEKARVNAGGITGTILPEQYWPALLGASMKFFSWYPYEGTYAPAATFANPAQMLLNYTADADAANHVDVMAAVSTPGWNEGVGVHFYHTLTKVTFTFQKKDPVPDVVTIQKIEFQGVPNVGKLTVGTIPAKTTANGKPGFVWNDVTTGNIVSTLSSNNTVTDDKVLLGDTFLMLPTDQFSDEAKIVVTTNLGEREFMFKDIVATKPHSWESGEYINYNITISNTIYQISATPFPWDKNPVIDVIFDGQYYLKLSQANVRLEGKGNTVDIVVKTNYNAIPYTGYPAGAQLTVTNTAWSEVSLLNSSEANGVYTYTIRAVISDYVGTVADFRDMRFYITAGNMNLGVPIQQWGGAGNWITPDIVFADNDPTTEGIKRRRKIVFNTTALTNSTDSWKWNWEISEIRDPDNILLNAETMLWANGTGGGWLYFYYKANATEGSKATLVLHNTNGDNPDVEIELTVPDDASATA